MFDQNGLAARLPVLREGAPWAYLTAFAAVAAATVLRLALDPFITGSQFVLFFPAIAVTALAAGLRAGSLAAALAVPSAWFLVIGGRSPLAAGASGDVVALVTFASTACLEVMVIGMLLRSLARVRELTAVLSACLHASPDALFVTGAGGRITQANNRAASIFGYPDGALAGLGIDDVLPGILPHIEALRRQAAQAPSGAGALVRGHAARRPDGTAFPADVSLAVVQVKGEPAVLATAHDTSEEMALSDGRAEIRRQQGILEERERSGAEIRRWADAVDAAAFGIAIIEPASARVAYANPAYMAMHGAAGDVAGGMSFAQVYHETEVDRVRSLLAAADSTGQAIVFEARRLRKDGSSYPAQVTLTSVRGPDGEISYRFVSVVDISDLKRTQEALRHAQKMEAIGNVTGGMAHDFNNLLGIIIGNLDLIGPLLQADRTGSEYLRETVDAALRGADLTRRLLAFARREPLCPSHTDVNEVVAGMARLLARLLGDDIRISVGLAPATWPVVVDRPWFEASIANLATNARDAMPRGGTLHLSTSNRRVGDGDASLHAGLRPGDYVLIEVSDSGAGIAPEMMSTIFEPFFTTKDTGRGTGLGLSMVFGFTRQSGGTVTVHSEPGHGATFCLFLPRAVQAPMASRSRKQVGALRGRGEVVLVVEDNPAMRRTVARQLADLGYAVISSGDGRDALKVLESARVDLLFSDIVMPGGIDGIGLARLALERHPRTAVLLTSAFPEGRLNGQMRKLGAALGFLKKPYRHHALARAVRDAIDGHEAAARPQSRTG